MKKDNITPKKEHRKKLLIEMMQEDEKNGMYDEPLPLNFWSRLEMFVSNVQVNDPMSEEEKEMILDVANRFKSL